MRRLAILGILAAVLAGCGGADEEPWSGEPDGFEPDDSMTTAREQRVNATAQKHTLYPAPDTDWVRFRVTAPDVDIADSLEPAYGLWIQGALGAPSAQLANERGGIPSPDGGLFDTPGVYFVRMDDAVDGEGEYSLWLTLHKNGDTLSDVVATTVTVEPESEAGLQTISVRVANQGGSVATDIICTAYVSADRVLDVPGDVAIGTGSTIPAMPENSFVTTTIDVDFSIAGVTPGPWYVLVNAEPFSAESDFTNNVGVGSTLVDVTSGDTRETGTPDDTIIEADGKTTLSPGGSISDLTLYPAGDVDVIKLFIPDISYCYEIQTQNLRGEANTIIEIVDADDNPIDYADAGGQETGGCYIWIDGVASLTDGMDYYVRVTSTEDLTGAYDISLRAGPILTPSGDAPVDYSSTLGYEPDDVFEPAIGVAAWRSIRPIDSTITITRAFSGDGTDIDYLVYAVSAADGDGETHTITVEGTGIDVKMTLLNHKGGDVDYGTAGTAPIDWQISRTLNAGLYYLKIENVTSPMVPGIYEIKALLPTL